MTRVLSTPAQDKLISESESFAALLKKSGIKCKEFVCAGLSGVHVGGLACRATKSGRTCLKETMDFVDGVLSGESE